jgi:hypothetical protein
MKYFADAIYEMSNGANYLGTVRFFTGGLYRSAADIHWDICGPGSANPSGFLGGGSLFTGDFPLACHGKPEEEANPVAYRHEDRRLLRKGYGYYLGHEALHYIYGLFDEYGSGEIGNGESGTGNIDYLDVDLTTNEIVLKHCKPRKPDCDPLFLDKLMEPFHPGVRLGGKQTSTSLGDHMPGGMPIYSGKIDEPKTPIKTLTRVADGEYRIALEGITFTSKAVGKWEIFGPNNFQSSPHSIGWDGLLGAWHPWYGKYSDYDFTTKKALLQWINFSTDLNKRSNNPHGRTLRNADGSSRSGWEVVSSDPENDLWLNWGKGTYTKGWTRHWYKSLSSKAPTSNDIYSAETYLNFNPTTGRWFDSDDQWWDLLPEQNFYQVDLPYTKVEIENMSDAELEHSSRKHLNVIWMDNPKIEVQIILDMSGSMAGDSKMENAKMATYFIADAFLSLNDLADSPDFNYEVTIGITGFEQLVNSIFPNTINPDFADIYEAVKEVEPLTVQYGQTKLRDAVSRTLTRFTQSPSSLKLAFIISDGLDNASIAQVDDVINQYLGKDVSITSFAYGDDADRSFLSALAEQTGGEFWDAPDHFFARTQDGMLSSIANSYFFQQLPDVELNSSTGSFTEIVLNEDVTGCIVYVNYLGDTNDVNIKVISPLGQEISQIARKTYSILNENTMKLLITESLIKEHGVGAWKIVKEGANDVSIKTLIQSNTKDEINFEVRVNPGIYIEYPEPITITASLTTGTIIIGSQVYGTLSLPNGNKISLPFSDDGENGDAVKDDGIYTSILPLLNDMGSYSVKAFANNKNSEAYSVLPITEDGREVHFELIEQQFELFDQTNFTLHGIVEDKHGDELTPTALSLPSQIGGKIDFLGDEDWFILYQDQIASDIRVSLHSLGQDFCPTVKFFNQHNLVQPVFEKSSSCPNTFLEFWVPSDLFNDDILIMITNQSVSDYRLYITPKDKGNIGVGRFKLTEDWNSGFSFNLEPILVSEGATSMAINVNGWGKLISRTVSTEEFSVVSQTLGLDFFVPTSLVNPYWVGTLDFRILIPSKNAVFFLGHVELTQLKRGMFNSLEFNIPDELLSEFKKPHDDVKFEFTLNSNGEQFIIDNLHFKGGLIENDVNEYDPPCSGSGCTIEGAIDLGNTGGINQFSAFGDHWFKITKVPNDWPVGQIFVNIRPLDGGVLTGSFLYQEQGYELSNWNFQVSRPYSGEDALFLKVHNIEGRPYEIQWWAHP